MKKLAFILLFFSLLFQVKAQFNEPIITRIEPVIDTFYNHYVIEDDYRWMEDVNSDEMVDWIKAQNRYSRKFLKKIRGRTKIGDLVRRYGDTKSWSKERIMKYTYRYAVYDDQSFPVLQYKGPGIGTWKTIFDPYTVSKDDEFEIRGYTTSDYEQYLAIRYSRNGSDKGEIRIVRLDDGRLMTDHLDHVMMFGEIVWYKNGFFYSTYESESYFGITQGQKVWYHKLNTGQHEDKLVFERKNYPLNSFTYLVSENDQFFILKEYFLKKKKFNIFYFDLGKDDFRVKPLLVNQKVDLNIFTYEDGKFLGTSNIKSGTGMIVEVDPAHPMKWKAITPSFSEAVLYDTKFLHDKIVAVYQTAHQPILAVLNYSGVVLFTLKLPKGTSAKLSGYDEKENDIYFYYTSYIVPPIVHKLNLSSFEYELYKKTEIKYNFADLAIEEAEYPSNDGTMIPITLVYRKDIKLDGNNPALLEAYGGFGIISPPRFNAGIVYFVERGGVYAFAGIRGGGKKGKGWADAGKGVNKQQSYDDFIAAAEYLIKKKYTSPQKLASHGASNGGLVVAVAAIQRPDLFKAVIPQVAPLDLLRYEKFTVAYHWTEEYGTVKDSASFTRLLSYSPYHNIKKDVNYPAMLIVTSDHDDRVPPFHSYKFTAALLNRGAQINPVLLKVVKHAGHSGSSTYKSYMDNYIDLYSFLKYELGERD